MRPQKQKNRHRPEDGLWGDCHRTCVAMLLDMDRDDIPNWGEIAKEDGAAFNVLVEDWLRSNGYASLTIPFNCSFEELGDFMLRMNPGIYYILGGESRTGVNHSVIAVNGQIASDPSLTDAGIVGPCNDGHFWITFLVPVSMTVLGGQQRQANVDPDYVGVRGG